MSERIERVMSEEAIERTSAAVAVAAASASPRTPHTRPLFLLSDAASWLTGVTLDVNGGRVML